MASQKQGAPATAYSRIAEQLRSSITHGRLPAGAKLPSERELASQHSVSLMTARRALMELDATGLVTRRVGSGTFVAPAGAGARRLHDPHEDFDAPECRLIATEPECVREWWNQEQLVVEERIMLTSGKAPLGVKPLLEYLALSFPYAVEEIWAENSQLRIRQTIYENGMEVAAVREMFVHGRTLRHGVR